MKIFKIKIENEGVDEFLTPEAGSRVQTVEEIVAFVRAAFNDQENMPVGATRMLIEPISSNLPPDYKLNPDFHL